MRVSSFISACVLLLCTPSGFANGPPPRMHSVPGPTGASIPYFNEYFYAYIGKVVGYSENEWKHPALEVQVLDAWTPSQKNGDILKVSVQPYYQDGNERSNFDPSKYPIGTRLRVIHFGHEILSWDAELALVVLGVGP